jgi:hypothetical protein
MIGLFSAIIDGRVASLTGHSINRGLTLEVTSQAEQHDGSNAANFTQSF